MGRRGRRPRAIISLSTRAVWNLQDTSCDRLSIIRKTTIFLALCPINTTFDTEFRALHGPRTLSPYKFYYSSQLKTLKHAIKDNRK